MAPKPKRSDLAGKAKPKAKGTSRASTPRKSATKSRSLPKAGAKAKPDASEPKPIKVREGEKAAVVLLSGGNPQIAKAEGVKVTFFRGTLLRPIPPGGTGKDARWIDIHEDDLDEAQMATWVKQAAALPGFLGPRP